MFRTLRNTACVPATTVALEVLALEARPSGCGFDELRPLVAGARGQAALQSGAVDDGVVWAGQVVSLIDDVPSCDALITRMVAECRERLAAAAAVAH